MGYFYPVKLSCVRLILFTVYDKLYPVSIFSGNVAVNYGIAVLRIKIIAALFKAPAFIIDKLIRVDNFNSLGIGFNAVRLADMLI